MTKKKPTKRGRPRVSDDGGLLTMRHVRFSDHEWERIKKEAGRKGLSASAYLRGLVLAALRPPPPYRRRMATSSAARLGILD